MFLSLQMVMVLLKKSESSKFIVLYSYSLLCGKVFLHFTTITLCLKSGRHSETVHKLTSLK